MFEQKAKNPSHQNGSKERRQGHTYRGDEKRQLVEKFSVDDSRQNAYHQAQHHRNGDGNGSQQQGIGESLAQNIGDLALALLGHAQVGRFQHDSRRT